MTTSSAAPTFSVVVTSYNYRAFVIEAIQSALRQTRLPEEIVVVDDGSTDGSPEMLKAEFGAVPRVRLILTANEGQLAAFQKGFAVCSGQVIAFLDADDSWDPTYLEGLARRYLQDSEIDCIVSNLRMAGGRQGRYSDLDRAWGLGGDRDFGLSALLVLHYQAWIGMPTSGVSMRRWTCQRVLDLPDDFAGDWRIRADDCLIYGADLALARKIYVHEPAGTYRIHAGNTWFDRVAHIVTDAKHQFRRERFIRYIAGRMGLGPHSFANASLEFFTKPRPTFRELKMYLTLGWRADLSSYARIRRAFSMIRHFVVTR